MENFIITGCSKTTNEVNTVIVSEFVGNITKIIPPPQIKITSLRPLDAYLIEFDDERFFAFIKTNTINYRGSSLSITIQRNLREEICNNRINPGSEESIKLMIKITKDTKTFNVNDIVIIYANRSLNQNIIIASVEIFRTKRVAKNFIL